jgi:spore maturation protein CgeB
MGREIDDEVIRYMKDNDTFLVNTYSDSFTDTVSKKVSINYNKSIKYYDIIFTPRESDFPLYESYGAKNVNKFWKGFDSNSISSFKRALIDLDFIFAGHMEKKRYEFFRYLISQQSFLYKIFGTGWKKTTLSNTYPSLPFEDYSSVYESTNIGVNFFSTWANDTQNSRLFEIPASNTLLVSERSEDALSCFEEDKEAIFFDSKEEFYDKLRFYTVNKVVADRIRERGFQKATNNYSNIARVKQMLSVISELIN